MPADAWTMICAAALWPSKSGGSVEMVWRTANLAEDGSCVNAEIVESSSFSTYTAWSSGWSARWRGPAPELTCGNGRSAGRRSPVGGSKSPSRARN